MLFRQIFKAGDVLLERGIVDQDVELAELCASIVLTISTGWCFNSSALIPA